MRREAGTVSRRYIRHCGNAEITRENGASNGVVSILRVHCVLCCGEIMEAQLQIRQEAQEKQDVLKDLLRWQPETQRRSGAKAASSIRSAGPAVPGKQEGLAPLRSSSSSQGKPGLQSSAPYTLRESVKKNAQANKGSAAGHTYDKASSKWDKFDYDAALAQADSENSGQNQSFSFPKGAKPAASIPR